MILNELLVLIATGGIALLIVFTITWLIQLETKNAAIVDSIWSASFPMLALIYFFLTDGFYKRNALILMMVFIWGMRLASYLFIRASSHPEDIRYTVLREQWGTRQNILMLRFFYFQGILALILSLPFALVMRNSSHELKIVEWIGAAIWVIGVTGTIQDQIPITISRYIMQRPATSLICGGGGTLTGSPFLNTI